MSSKLKKIFGSSSLLTLAGSVKAMGWGLVVLVVFVIFVAVAICLLLERLADIPPIDREKQLNAAWGWGDMYGVYTNKGLPPSFSYTEGVDSWPMDYYNTHPLTNNGVVYDYFELVQYAKPAPIIIVACRSLTNNSERTYVGTAGEGANTGLTNDTVEVSITAGRWNIKPTAYAISNFPCMFWICTSQ
jgi:hypothetical protein